MSRFSRRDILGGAVTTGAALGAAAVAQAEPKQLPIQNMKKTAQNATVYHCDFGDAGRFSQQLRNINNHLAVYNYDQRAFWWWHDKPIFGAPGEAREWFAGDSAIVGRPGG